MSTIISLTFFSVYLLPARLRRLWPSPPPIGWPWSSRFPTCETCFIRRTFICIRRPFELELTSFLLTLETVIFLFHLLSATSKPLVSLSTRLAHAARLGFFYKNALYKFTVIIQWRHARGWSVRHSFRKHIKKKRRENWVKSSQWEG